ncbi:hypothetical protein EU545_04070 [Candidatus Thorarchaeota archaeon]|nr:MAG: hypothetical protein EU545_04070 [Candidatus Thorarchaeota archaeon]
MEESSQDGTNDDSHLEKEEQKEIRRPFNPMKTYFFVAAGIIGSYALFYLFGYTVLTVATLFFLMVVFQETRYVYNHLSYRFARGAAYFNAFHALAYFIILSVNGYWIVTYGVPLILPQIQGLTLMAPLIVFMSAFGSRNIRLMYIPDKKV